LVIDKNYTEIHGQRNIKESDKGLLKFYYKLVTNINVNSKSNYLGTLNYTKSL